MVKLPNSMLYLIPWFDSEGNKQWLRVTMHGEPDRRRVLRNLRRLCQHNFSGIAISNRWIKNNVVFMNTESRFVKETEEELQRRIDAWILRISEDNNSPDSDSQEGTSKGTEKQVSSVSNFFRESSE